MAAGKKPGLLVRCFQQPRSGLERRLGSSGGGPQFRSAMVSILRFEFVSRQSTEVQRPLLPTALDGCQEVTNGIGCENHGVPSVSLAQMCPVVLTGSRDR